MPRLVLLSLQHETRFRWELRRMSIYFVSVPPVGVKSHCPLIFLGATSGHSLGGIVTCWLLGDCAPWKPTVGVSFDTTPQAKQQEVHKTSLPRQGQEEWEGRRGEGAFEAKKSWTPRKQIAPKIVAHKHRRPCLFLIWLFEAITLLLSV